MCVCVIAMLRNVSHFLPYLIYFALLAIKKRERQKCRLEPANTECNLNTCVMTFVTKYAAVLHNEVMK